MHWESGAFVGRCTMLLPMAHKITVPDAKRPRLAARDPPRAPPAKAEPSECKEESEVEGDTQELTAIEGDAEQFGVAAAGNVKDESFAGEPAEPKEELVEENGFAPPPPAE